MTLSGSLWSFLSVTAKMSTAEQAGSAKLESATRSLSIRCNVVAAYPEQRRRSEEVLVVGMDYFKSMD